MSLREISHDTLSSREEAIEHFTKKYERKRNAVFLQINNLRSKLNPDQEENESSHLSPRKRERQLKELSRLEKCYSHIHSVERRVQAALMRNRIF